MIYTALRAALFRLGPEIAHDLAIRTLSASPVVMRHLGIPAEVFGLKVHNRLGMAAGFDKNGVALSGIQSLGFGFCEIGTVTCFPQLGNTRPRITRLPKERALLNSMGFPNLGADAVRLNLDRYRNRYGFDFVVGVNIGKSLATRLEDAPQDYLKTFERLYEVGDYFVVNVSSPNTPGLRDLQTLDNLSRLLGPLVDSNEKAKPILVKISPSLRQMDSVVRAVEGSGIQGVVAANTGPSPDGGISGPSLFPGALSMVGSLREALPDALVVGCGGVSSRRDHLAMRQAGADLVQLYTSLIYEGPSLIRDILTRSR